MEWYFHCSEFVEEGRAVCQRCGRDPKDLDSGAASELPDDPPIAVAMQVDPPSPRGAAARRAIVLSVAVLGIVGLAAGAGVVTLLQTSEAPEVVPVSIDAPLTLGALGAARGPLAPEADASPNPVWTRPSWADTMPRVVAFELEADNDVRVATRRVRPLLGISCASGVTGVYVMTGGAASIDSETPGHTVHITFDETGEFVQQWLDADDHQALFAPDPRALAGRLATVQRMRFGFTHYLSGAVVVDFDLRGADEWVRSVARPCGWAP